MKIQEKMKSWLPFIYLVVIIFGLRWTIVEPYVVPTGSMEPTLKKGDRLFALKCAYDVRFPFTEWILFRTGEVKRGDVILFKAPHDPSITYVKRAIGLPGDLIEYKMGVLKVNGEVVDSSTAPDRGLLYDVDPNNEAKLLIETNGKRRHYVLLDNLSEVERSRMEYEFQFSTVRVPDGHLFAMGDHRDHSFDSRFWGFVPMQNLKGKGLFIWYSSPPVVTGDTLLHKIYDMAAGWYGPRPERIGTMIQ